MNYKELQNEVKRLAELTGLPRPSLNTKREILEAALIELQSADAQDTANERGDVDYAADSIEFFTELEDEDKKYYGLPATVNTPDPELVEVVSDVKSTPDIVAIALATTASDILDVTITVATKVIKATVGLAMLSVISVAYFAFVAWQHFSQYSKDVLIPRATLLLREGIHKAFYYSQKAYAEATQVKALINGIPFVS